MIDWLETFSSQDRLREEYGAGPGDAEKAFNPFGHLLDCWFEGAELLVEAAETPRSRRYADSFNRKQLQALGRFARAMEAWQAALGPDPQLEEALSTLAWQQVNQFARAALQTLAEKDITA